jgi:hypothetical protein
MQCSQSTQGRAHELIKTDRDHSEVFNYAEGKWCQEGVYIGQSNTGNKTANSTRLVGPQVAVLSEQLGQNRICKFRRGHGFSRPQKNTE